MLERVRQGLLDDPVGRDVHGRRQRPLLALDSDLDGQLRLAHRRRQARQLPEPRLGGQWIGVPRLAQEAEQPVQLLHRVAARQLDRGQRLLRLLRVPVDDDAPGAGLDAHHADVVGDDVVQLPGDPHALLKHRAASVLLAFALSIGRALIGRLGLHHALAQGKADEPGDREQGRGEDELAGRVRRVVVDDDRDAAEHHGESDAPLGGVSDAAEQERRRHPSGEHAARVHGKAAVDERDRGG